MIKTWQERKGNQGGYANDVAYMGAEIDELRAALDAAQNQEPVATVRAKSDAYGGTFVHWVKMPVAGMSLYLAPGAQPKDQS
jgi:hypothetical protein